MPLILGTNSIKDTGYDVANSLRFNSGSTDYLERSFSSDSNKRTFTYSLWVKKCTTASGGALFGSTDGSGGYIWYLLSSTVLYLQNNPNSSMEFQPTQKFRDLSAWMHIVLAIDTTQSTESNRVKIYLNGSQITSFTTDTYPSQNQDLNFATSQYLRIGEFGGEKLNAYLSEVAWIDGSQLDATSFGEFDEDSGIWKPKDFKDDVTFGTNGFYLEFKESGTSQNSSGLGADTSGNNNHFAVNNLTAVDQSTDTCTNNYATYNSLISLQSQTYSEGNLQVATTSSNKSGGSSTIGVASGKWYAEFKVTDSNNRTTIGITSDPSELDRQNQYVGFGAYDYSYIAELGNKANNNSESSYGNSYTQNDIIGVAVDLDNNKIYFSKNGTWQNSGDPTSGATGTGSAFTLTASSSTPSGFYFFGAGDVASNQTGTIQANFGSPPYSISSGNTDGNGYGNFEYAVPSGYYSLNSKNLAEYG